MKDHARRVEYFPLVVEDRPGEALRIAAEIKKRRMNLLAIHGFPLGEGKAQIDIVPEDPTAFGKTAKEQGWKMGEKKVAFLIQGEDRAGAIADIYTQLADARVNVVAETGIAAGNGRYGCILWVAAKDLETATSVLGAGELVR